MDIFWVDTHQFVSTMLIWTVSIPVLLFLCFTCLRDNIRYACIPVIIATLVFQVLIVIHALWVIAWVVFLWQASHYYVIVAHTYNIIVLLITLCIAALYRYFFAKRDLLKADDEEIDAA